MNRATALAAAVALAILFLPTALSYADRCILPITDADVFGSGQKAIIAWNGGTERLILSTDLYANADTRVLEVLPLPSKPSVEEGQFDSFQAAQDLMMENAQLTTTSQKEALSGFAVVIHEQIGAHDITVVEATSIDDLTRYLLEYTKGISSTGAPRIDRARAILADYLARGFDYWVFDAIDLQQEVRSLTPIIYEFQSPTLYFPLKVSTTEMGTSMVTLYLITPRQVDENEIPGKMRLGRVVPSGQPIQFQLSMQDLTHIDQALARIFPVADGPAAWFTAVKYEGDLSNLDFDLELSLHSSTSQCRAIEVSTDKTMYSLGEGVVVSVHFTHLLPECVEPLILEVVHTHLIKLQILDADNGSLKTWQWSTDKDFTGRVAWMPRAAGTYTVAATAFWESQMLSSQREEAADKTTITVLGSAAQPGREMKFFLYGMFAGAVCLTAGIAIACLLMRSRQK